MNPRLLLGIIVIIILALMAGVIGFAINQQFAVVAPQNLPEKPVETQAAFGAPITLTVNQSATFSDGLIVTLNKINDSRCKQGVVCVWAGELAYELKAGTNEFILGTVNNKKVTKEAYVFELNSGTETQATLTVTKNVVLASCYVGGCSNQLCSDQKDMVSTCEYREAYACYKTAICERQTNGQCGWSQTATLKACLTSAK